MQCEHQNLISGPSGHFWHWPFGNKNVPESVFFEVRHLNGRSTSHWSSFGLILPPSTFKPWQRPLDSICFTQDLSEWGYCWLDMIETFYSVSGRWSLSFEFFVRLFRQDGSVNSCARWRLNPFHESDCLQTWHRQVDTFGILFDTSG